MNRTEYFKARLEATLSPMGYRKEKKEHPEGYILVDVRVGPDEIKKEKIENAIVVPLNELPNRIEELPKEKTIVLYCWDTWCTLAAKAAILLLEQDYDAKELYGGLAAWKTLDFPTIQLSGINTYTEKNIECEC